MKRMLRIGPNLKKALLDPASEFWEKAANYGIQPLAFQSATGEYLGCNHSFEDMTGTPAAQVIGSRPSDLFEASIAHLLERTRRRAAARLMPTNCLFWKTFRHGAYLYVECRCFPVLDERGLLGFATFYTSENDLFLAQETLKTTLQVLCHDLLTPLRGMLSCVRRLDYGKSPERMARLQQRLISLYKICLEQLKIWMTVDKSRLLTRQFRAYWIHSEKIIRETMNALRRRTGYPAAFSVNMPPDARLLWSRRNLVALLTHLVDLARDWRARETRGSDELFFTFRSGLDHHELEVTVPFLLDPEEVESRWYTSSEALLSLAKGVRMECQTQDGQTRVAFSIPQVQTAVDDSEAAEPMLYPVQDYHGANFHSPGSLYCARFDLLQQLVGIFNRERRVEAASRAFAQFFRRSPESMIGQPYTAFVSPYLATVFDELFSQGEQHRDQRGILARRELPLCVNGVVNHHEIIFSNAVEGGHVINIFYRREMMQSRLFFQTMLEIGGRHLLTLLKSIRETLIELLALEDHGASAGGEVALLREETTHVIGILEHWQRLEQIERGDYRLTYSPINIVKLLRGIALRYRLGEDVVRVKRVTPTGETAPILVKGDEDLLYTLFNNLLGNAKHAAHGGLIEIVIERLTKTILVSVRNVGETPPYIRGMFFEKFIKGPDSSGMGLGTYSAKIITELHHGHIEIDASEPGYTTIRVELPSA